MAAKRKKSAKKRKRRDKAQGWGAGKFRKKRRTRFGLLSNRQYTALEAFNRAMWAGDSPTVAMLKTHGYRGHRRK